MRILITGSAGFIGFHLHKHLHNYFDVTGCDNLSSVCKFTQKLRLQEIKKNKLKFIRVDLNNAKILSKKFNNKKFDFIIHLAAQPGVRISQIQPVKTINNNLVSFINLFEYAIKNKVRNIFYASSSSVYGNTENFSENLSHPNPVSVYGVSKVANEYLAKTYNFLNKINSIGLRFFTVYGPLGREDMSYYKFLNSIKNSKKIEIYGDKTSKRSFTYIDDIVISIHKLINVYKNKKSYLEILNIGNSESRSLEDLVKIIKNIVGVKFREKYVERNKADVYKTSSNNFKLNKIIKFKPKISLEKGMYLFSNWYKNKVSDKIF